MKKVLLLAVLGTISFPALAQKAELEKPPVAKPYTKRQRTAIIKQMRKDGKLLRVENVEPVPVVVSAPVALQIDLINIPPAQFLDTVIELVKTPDGIFTIMQQIPVLSAVQIEKVALALNGLTPTQIQTALVHIPAAGVESLLSQVVELPPGTQVIVLKVLSLAPVKTVQAALVNVSVDHIADLLLQVVGLPESAQIAVVKVLSLAPVETLQIVLTKTDPALAALLVKEIPTPRLVDLATAFTGSLAKGHIANNDMEKLALLLETAGVNPQIVQAFIERLTQ